MRENQGFGAALGGQRAAPRGMRGLFDLSSRPLRLVALSCLSIAPAFAETARVPNDRRAAEGPVLVAEADGKPRVTIVGTRVTQGDAVECPKLRADDGKTYPVSYLAPSVAIGDRVSVTGFFAIITRCVGEVLYVEEARAASGG